MKWIDKWIGLLHSDEVLTKQWENKSSLAQNMMIKRLKYIFILSTLVIFMESEQHFWSFDTIVETSFKKEKKSPKVRPSNNYKPTGHLIRYQNLLINTVKKSSKSDQKLPNWPKNVKNQANWKKNIPKLLNLLQKSYSQKKVQNLPSKSYYWSLNLLCTLCLGADTIWVQACLILGGPYPINGHSHPSRPVPFHPSIS